MIVAVSVPSRSEDGSTSKHSDPPERPAGIVTARNEDPGKAEGLNPKSLQWCRKRKSSSVVVACAKSRDTVVSEVGTPPVRVTCAATQTVFPPTSTLDGPSVSSSPVCAWA